MNEEPEENAPPASPSEKPPLKALTPEQRRFLGRPRTRHDRSDIEEEPAQIAPPPARIAKPVPEQPLPPKVEPKPAIPAESESVEAPPEEPGPAQRPAAVALNWKLGRVLQMQKLVLTVGAIFLLGATFYVGHKFAYWKYLIMSRNQPKLSEMASNKYPGLSADELIEQALVAQRLGNWQEAVERLLVAKQRNLTYRGILFRAGKLCYDQGDFDMADKLFERASAFGEDVGTSNYLRALIAVGHNDLAAAKRFFEAAVNADPFTPGYFYYWAEALRRDHQPNEAMRRYEQAGARANTDQDAILCRFKVRMARIEAAEASQLSAELEKKRSEGALSVDWLLTDAALQIQQSDIAGAVQVIEQARTADERRLYSLFSSCTADMLFVKASRNHPEIEQACRVGSASSSPTPVPMATP